MAATPHYLTLKDSRDARGRGELAARRVLVGVLAALAVAALLGVFGQREERSTAAAADATLSVVAPDRLRGGLFYQGRFTVLAERDIARATLVLDRGWTEGMHINTIEPAPVGESSRDGLLALDMGHVAAGDEIVLYMQLQVNPTNYGRRSQGVRLFDGERQLAEVDRTVTVFP